MHLFEMVCNATFGGRTAKQIELCDSGVQVEAISFTLDFLLFNLKVIMGSLEI